MDINELAKIARDSSRHIFIETVKADLDSILRLAESFAPMSSTCTCEGFICGAYNCCIKLRLSSGGRWIIRFPFPSENSNSDEKFRGEIAAMQFVSLVCPEIPIPTIVAFGTGEQGALEGCPYLIMEMLDGKTLESVWPKIKGDEKLRRKVFCQLADIVLCLARMKFAEIGSIPSADFDQSMACVMVALC